MVSTVPHWVPSVRKTCQRDESILSPDSKEREQLKSRRAPMRNFFSNVIIHQVSVHASYCIIGCVLADHVVRDGRLFIGFLVQVVDPACKPWAPGVIVAWEVGERRCVELTWGAGMLSCRGVERAKSSAPYAASDSGSS